MTICVACAKYGLDFEATVAIATRRPTRGNLWTKVWWEESEAPAYAERLCGEHAMKTITDLAKVLA